MDIAKLIGQATKKFFSQIQRLIGKAIKFLFAPENWPYLVAVILAIILISVALYVWRKKRKAKKAAVPGEPQAEAASPEEEQEPEQPAIPKSSLFNVWKKFLKGIPGKFRRSIMLYQPFVVLGDSGSGKSLLINNYTDWQGQARQFYPSYTQDPLLQIYLGSKMIVQELPASLLHNSGTDARIALLKIWKPLFLFKEPTVVVVLNATALKSGSPESLKKLAQVIRGKINLISEVRKKPVKVCIALTYMDQMEGFDEFTDFLRESGIPLKLEFKAKKERPPANDTRFRMGAGPDTANLETCLEPYEVYLTRALTTLPADDYLKMMSFLRSAPELLSVLGRFVRILQTPGPLSPEPQIIRLSLASHRERDHLISNPFTSTLSKEEIRRFNPILRHRITAALIAVLALAYLGGGYLYHHGLLENLYRKAGIIEKQPRSGYHKSVKDFFADFDSMHKDDLVLKMVPDFFPKADPDLRERLVRAIQKNYLNPDLRLLSKQEDALEPMLYLLALKYATQTNNLGKLVRKDIESWCEKLGYPSDFANIYIRMNDKQWDEPVKFEAFPLRTTAETPDGNMQEWVLFFRKVAKLSNRQYLGEAQFRKLRVEADRFMQKIIEAQRYDLLVKIISLLEKEAPLKIQMDLMRQSGLIQVKEAIGEHLRFLLNTHITYPDPTGMDFGEFMDNAMTLLEFRDTQDSVFRFDIGQQEFIFSGKKWKDLVFRTQLYLFIKNFMNLNKRNNGLMFFRTGEDFADIVMNPTNRGELFFTGKSSVDGWYTFEAFEMKVRPAIASVPGFLAASKSHLRKKETVLFSNFVLKQVEAYAKQYAREYRDYYKSFHIKAPTLIELRYVLSQLRETSSAFQEFLASLNENAVVEIGGDEELLKPFAAELAQFDFIRRLMAEEKGVVPELGQYLAIMEQMKGDLEAETAAGADLRGSLPPVGKIALAIFLEEEESYKSMTDKWLLNAGVPSDAWHLFQEPVDSAYAIGLREIESRVALEWEKLRKVHIDPTAFKFPFDRNAEKQVETAELEIATHPEGRFWTAFNGMVSPVCLKTNEGWKSRSASITLPEDMLETANAVMRLTRILWDEAGNMKPVAFSVKPLPMPPIVKDEPAMVLAFIQCGDNPVFGFNQMASWKNLPMEWWAPHASAIGVEFATPGVVKKAFASFTVPESNWSFLRLLNSAKVEDQNTHVWEVEGPKPVKRKVKIRFSLKSDPWDIFKWTN